MANFFDRMLGRNNKDSSSAIAKSRLQVVLVHDRINLPPERLREMQAEILAVIARYVPVDPDEIAIMLEQPDRNSGRLVAQIPFGKGRYPAENDFSTYTEDDDLDLDHAHQPIAAVSAETTTETALADGDVGETMSAVIPDTLLDATAGTGADNVDLANDAVADMPNTSSPENQ